MSTDRRVTAARDLGIAAAGLVPPAKAWLAEMRFLRQPHFTAGCIVPPAAHLPRALRNLVGRSLPQPTVTTETGEQVRLDALLRAGWTLLRSDRGALAVVSLRHDGAPVTRVASAPADWLGTEQTVSLLVRPDRYVAAVTSLDEEESALGVLSPLVPWLPTAYAARPTPLLAS
jgi:3-(3-hydroxy-phenyl)propionate hydroxylase